MLARAFICYPFPIPVRFRVSVSFQFAGPTRFPPSTMALCPFFVTTWPVWLVIKCQDRLFIGPRRACLSAFCFSPFPQPFLSLRTPPPGPAGINRHDGGCTDPPLRVQQTRAPTRVHVSTELPAPSFSSPRPTWIDEGMLMSAQHARRPGADGATRWRGRFASRTVEETTVLWSSCLQGSGIDERDAAGVCRHLRLAWVTSTDLAVLSSDASAASGDA